MVPETHYRVSGAADAPTLILVHPWGARLEFWDECIELWSRRFQVVACDLRGAGYSPTPHRLWRVADHGRDLVLIRKHLRLDRVVVVGCAIGSLVAAAYTDADAAHVAGLVLCDTARQLGEESRRRTQARVDLVRREGMGVLLPVVVDMAFEAQPRDKRYRRYTEMFASNDPEGYAAIALGMMGTDNTDALGRIACPTLVVAGAHDTLLPPSLSREVHALVAGSEFRIIDSAAHFPPFQAPTEFADLVEDFVDRRVWPASG
jgi:3-oxoadipate enol-lactonase